MASRLTARETAALVEDLRRGVKQNARGVELDGEIRCTSGAEGVVLEEVRGLRLAIGRRLLRGRPTFRGASVERSSFRMLKARSADFTGVSLSAVSIGGPFEAFEDCTFTDCSFDGVTIRENTRFRDCTFVDCALGLTATDGVVFSNCRLRRVSFTGQGELSIVGSELAECDASSFLMTDGVLSAVGEADLRLPATEACFFVPRSALEGPLADRRSRIASPVLEARVLPLGRFGVPINPARLRAADPSGQEAEELLAALWPHHVENLREATPPAIG